MDNKNKSKGIIDKIESNTKSLLKSIDSQMDYLEKKKKLAENAMKILPKFISNNLVPYLDDNNVRLDNVSLQVNEDSVYVEIRLFSDKHSEKERSEIHLHIMGELEKNGYDDYFIFFRK